MQYKLNRLPILSERCGNHSIKYDSDNSLSVEYKFNDYGYRASFDYDPLLDSEKIVCIGCSFTEGVGLHENETWPHILSQQIGLPYLNLGVAGGSQGYVMWQIMNVINNIQSKNIFVLSPPWGRFFELTDSEFENKQSWDVETETKTYSNFYDLNNFVLARLCKSYGIHHIDCLKFGGGHNWTKARDNQHFGIEYHQKIAKEFYNLTQPPKLI
jgi:hypothetical protein